MDGKRITILGLGNVLLKDEGFGVHFVRRFAERYRFPEGVRVVDGGTLGYILLDDICSCEHLIVVDVIKTGAEPGSVYRFARDEMERYLPPSTSAHEVQFQDVLVKAELIGQVPEVVFLCITPGSYEGMSMELTPRLSEKLPLMETFVLKELARFNIVPERINDA
jgi:hydrogenase maturation protease